MEKIHIKKNDIIVICEENEKNRKELLDTVKKQLGSLSISEQYIDKVILNNDLLKERHEDDFVQIITTDATFLEDIDLDFSIYVIHDDGFTSYKTPVIDWTPLDWLGEDFEFESEEGETSQTLEEQMTSTEYFQYKMSGILPLKFCKENQ